MYRPIFNQLIFEELSISGEVQQETVNMWKKIKDCIPQIKLDAYVDYDYATHNEIVLEGVKYGSYSFSSYIFNEKITVFINLYNFVDKSHYNKYKDKIEIFKASSVYQDNLKWLIITIPMISGNIIYGDYIKENLQHELEHLYQGKHGASNIIKSDDVYAKALRLLGNKDNDISDIALVIYLSNTSEQDAFVNGMYSYLMSQSEPMIDIKWSVVKNSDAYLHLASIKKIIDKLENPDQEIIDKCKNYFDLSPYQLLKIAKSVEFRLTRKIGKVLAKYHKDIRNKYNIKETFSGKYKNNDYFNLM